MDGYLGLERKSSGGLTSVTTIDPIPVSTNSRVAKTLKGVDRFNAPQQISTRRINAIVPVVPLMTFPIH